VDNKEKSNSEKSIKPSTKSKEFEGIVLIDFAIDGVSYRSKRGDTIYKTTDKDRFDKLIKQNKIKQK
jgi:hypothetical protein